MLGSLEDCASIVVGRQNFSHLKFWSKIFNLFNLEVSFFASKQWTTRDNARLAIYKYLKKYFKETCFKNKVKKLTKEEHNQDEDKGKYSEFSERQNQHTYKTIKKWKILFL